MKLDQIKQVLHVGPVAITLALLCQALLLSACGSGQGGATAPATSGNQPSVPSNTGSVSANFVATGTGSQVFLSSWMLQSYGAIPAASFVQAAGAMTTLGNFTLSGNPAVTQDISGDANYAQGRWVWGTVKNPTFNVTDTMNGSMPSDAWHYVVANRLAALPTTGVRTCDAGTFTTPTLIFGGGTNTGTTTASNVTLSFSAAGATLGFTLSTTANGSTGTTTFSATNLTLNSITISGNLGVAPYAAIYLGDGGGGAIRIVGNYSITLPNGTGYLGAYSFRCI